MMNPQISVQPQGSSLCTHSGDRIILRPAFATLNNDFTTDDRAK
jgi:hypothetical protein